MSTLTETDRRSDRGVRWPQGESNLPWFDRPDAVAELDRRASAGRYDERQVELLRKWITDGYVVVRDVVDDEAIDGMLADLDGLWETDEPMADLRIEQLKLAPGGPEGVAHSDLVKVDRAERLALRNSQIWRIHGFHLHSEATRAIYQSARLRDLCSLIFDAEALPQYTINFMYGSRQGLHQDQAVFHIHPRNYLIGAWLACEDIDPASGPLVYYPRSHRCGMFEGFENYPQTNLRTCDPELSAAYYAWLEEQSHAYERREFLPRKGEVLLWHGLLIHGGGEVRAPELTRKSYVCHYIPEGMNRHEEIEGPFNW